MASLSLNLVPFHKASFGLSGQTKQAVCSSRRYILIWNDTEVFGAILQVQITAEKHFHPPQNVMIVTLNSKQYDSQN